jgi:hypothetical protein
MCYRNYLALIDQKIKGLKKKELKDWKSKAKTARAFEEELNTFNRKLQGYIKNSPETEHTNLANIVAKMWKATSISVVRVREMFQYNKDKTRSAIVNLGNANLTSFVTGDELVLEAPPAQALDKTAMLLQIGFYMNDSENPEHPIYKTYNVPESLAVNSLLASLYFVYKYTGLISYEVACQIRHEQRENSLVKPSDVVEKIALEDTKAVINAYSLLFIRSIKRIVSVFPKVKEFIPDCISEDFE